MHVTLAVVVGLIVGGVVGALGYSKTAARYDAMTTACVMVNQAVEHQILKPEQVKELGELTQVKPLRKIMLLWHQNLSFLKSS